MLSQLLYVSSAVPALSEHSVLEILNQSRARNRAAQITGMLLYVDSSFIQVLEGEELAVGETFARIHRDPRHADILVLYRERVEERSFTDWSMGYHRLSSDRGTELEGLFALSSDAIQEHLIRDRAERVLRFLRTFYRVTARDIL